MAGPYSYSGDPSASDKDLVRFLLGDTDVAAGKLTDAEIDYLVDAWVDPYLAAAEGAQQISSAVAHWFSYTADGMGLTLDQLQAKYLVMSDQLRAQWRRRNRGGPYAGAIDQGEHDMVEDDASLVPLSFKIGMTDMTNLGVASSPLDIRDLRRRQSE